MSVKDVANKMEIDMAKVLSKVGDMDREMEYRERYGRPESLVRGGEMANAYLYGGLQTGDVLKPKEGIATSRSMPSDDVPVIFIRYIAPQFDIARGLVADCQVGVWDAVENKFHVTLHDSGVLKKVSSTHVEKVEKVKKSSGICREVVDDFNMVFASKYRGGEALRKQINARCEEGYGLEDFKKVHRNMYNTWGGDQKMAKYLRPQTLWGTKFSAYLNTKTKSIGYVPEDIVPF